MQFLARVFLTLFFFIFLFLQNTSTINAEGEFETDYEVTYSVDEQGKTTVSQDITLKNQTPNFYADQFSLKIGSTKINNVIASDSTGTLPTEINFENNLTTITVTFNQKVIGTGKSLPWTLTYTSDELAIKNGQIWEISIPKLARSTDIGSYEARVIVPGSFGQKSFAVPEPAEEITLSSSQTYIFGKDQLLQSGIAMSFGEKQVFSFKLDYFLENKNVTSQIKEITLPPDNNYQQIVLEKLEPEPLDIVVDNDGNFLAQYKLPARGTLDVTAQGYIEVFHKPFRKIKSSLSTKEKDTYIQPQLYWETDNGFIQDKANELKTPDKIYEFVVNFLNYSQERLNNPSLSRKGAQAAISNPQDAVCMEFTDLFIAISRAAGIPTREVVGYAYTQNERLRPLSLAIFDGDLLHAWPEYWDEENGWIQIDPTWGSTSGGLDYFNKLDFNHITFVQRGLSSTSPQPPGAFKRSSGTQEKTVFIEFANELPNVSTNPQLSLDSPAKITSGLPTKVEAVIKNGGSTSIFNESLTLTTSVLKNTKDSSYEIPILPPLAKRTFDYQLNSPTILSSGSDTLVLSYSETFVEKPINIQPIYRLVYSASFMFTILAIVVIVSVAFLIQKKFIKNKNSGIKLPKIP